MALMNIIRLSWLACIELIGGSYTERDGSANKSVYIVPPIAFPSQHPWSAILFTIMLFLSVSISSPFFISQSARAATIKVERAKLWQDDIPLSRYQDGTDILIEPRCNVVMNGEIVQGDLDQLKAAYKIAVPGGKMNPSYLCLNSPGGNLSEAILIVKWMLEGEGRGIATMVDAGASCLSACALIFLGGSRIDHDVTGYAPMAERWLHVGGRLGFHAPYLDTSSLPETLTRDVAVNFYKVAIETSNKIISIFQHSQRGDSTIAATFPWARSSLFTELMLKGPNEFIFIDNIDAAGRWNINLVGLKRPAISALKENHAKEACRNAIAWSQDRFAARESFFVDGTILERKVFTKMPPSQQYTVRASSRNQEDCKVEFTSIGGVLRNTSVAFSREKQPIPNLTGGGDWWAFIPADTPLATIARGISLTVPTATVDPPSVPIRKDGKPQSMHPNMRIVTGVLDWATQSASSLLICSQSCEGVPFCVGVSYHRSNRTCYLHDNVDGLRLDPNFISVRQKIGNPAGTERR